MIGRVRMRTSCRLWRALAVLAATAALYGCNDGVVVDDGADAQVTDVVELPLDSDPITLARANDSFRGDHFSGAGECSACHDGLVAEDGSTVNLVGAFRSSMMANSARDPYWIAKVAAELHRNPGLEGDINETCSRCHVPMANEASRRAGSSLQLLGENGVLSDDNPLFDHAMDGVSCTLCHQIEDSAAFGTAAADSGAFVVNRADSISDRVAYGPYSDPVAGFMQAQVRFRPAFGPHMAESAVCASCHDLDTQPVNNQGQPVVTAYTNGLFPEQKIFSEWAASDFSNPASAESRTCQSCHMPEVPGTMALATRGGELDREGVSRHNFLGANTVMQRLLSQYRDELGVIASESDFAESIAANRAFLETAADIDFDSLVVRENELLAELRITNRTGHKLPGGYDSRRLFVHFTVSDASGQLLFESGRPNSDGSIEGASGDLSGVVFEPHHERITQEDQVAIYESEMLDANGRLTHSPLRAVAYAKDNRLLPPGALKARLAGDITVVGAAATDRDFDAGGDRIDYQVSVPAGSDLTVRARLIYQPIARNSINALASESDLPEVAGFISMFMATSVKWEVIAETQGSVSVR